MKSKLWMQHEAIALCVAIEAICPKFGCHVALTGGLLYKSGPRKDCDILFYRIREASEIKDEKLFEALEGIGLMKKSGFGWCVKCEYKDKKVDCFFPEEIGWEYISEEETADPSDKPTTEDLLR